MSGLVERLQEVIQDAFNKSDADLGAHILGDWILTAEVHSSKGQVLRIVSRDDTPAWRRFGLLKFALKDLELDMTMYRFRGEDDEA